MEFKDGRYRVTVKNIILVLNKDTPYNKSGTESTFEETWAKKGKDEFKGMFKGKAKNIYQANLNDVFTVKNEESSKDDW